MKELFVKYTVNIFTIATVLIVAWIVLANPFKCGKEAGATANNKADSALQVIAAVHTEVSRLQDTLKALRKDSIQQRINAEALAEETNSSYEAVFAAQNETKSYQNKYADARKQVNDLLALATCDSLTQAITVERTKANKAQQDCKNQVNQLGDILANRNKQISVLNQQVAVLKQPANIVNDALHAAKAAVKEPWIKGYAGASVMGNQTSFGFGPDVSLLFRSGVMVRGGAILMGSQVMGQIGIAKLISFKK